MSREPYGVFIGALTLAVSFLPLPAFILASSTLSLLIGKELCYHLKLKNFYPSAFFSPVLFYLSPSLGGIYVALVSLSSGYRVWSLEAFFRSVFVLFYTGFFISFLILIKERSTYLLLVLIFSMWANDVVAYYVGKNLGKTPLLPKLSPKKTLEGFLGGLLAGTLLMVLLLERPLFEEMLVGISTLTSGVAGDYFKSFIKRQLSIKDFSNILGEHGGFTDRFDALLFSAPVFYWLIYEI